MTDARLEEILKRALGAGAVESNPETLARYALHGRVPEAVVRPATPEQAAETLAVANSGGWGLIPWGAAPWSTTPGGAMPGGRAAGTACCLPPDRYHIALGTTGLNQLMDHDQDNLTLTAGAGLTLAAANRVLAEGHQFLPLGFGGEHATLGGLIAGNPLLSKRLLYGDARDLLLGVQVALPDGKLVRYGRKVIKNVAGYDMNKMFLGSQGMLGVIVEVTCKLFALPDEETVLVAGFGDLPAAAAAARELLGSPLLPSFVCLLDSGGADAFRSAQPLTGQPFARQPGSAMLVTGFEGRGAVLRRQREGGAAIMHRHGAQSREAGDAQSLGTLVLDSLSPGTQALIAGRAETAPGTLPSRVSPPTVSPPTIVRLGVPAERLVGWMEELAAGAFGVPSSALVADCAAGSLRVHFAPLEPGVADSPEVAGTVSETLPGTVARLRERLIPEGGFAILESAPEAVAAAISPWGDGAAGLRTMEKLRFRFDPNGIMTPERFLAGPGEPGRAVAGGKP